MKEYKLPSGKASIETTGGMLATTEYTVPSKASERNKALYEALDQCLHLSAQCGQLQLQRDIERESVKQLTVECDALAAQVAEFNDAMYAYHVTDISEMQLALRLNNLWRVSRQGGAK